MAKRSIVLVAGATAEELAQLQDCLSDWECLSAPLNEEETGITLFEATAELVVVYARNEGKNTIAICEQLRNLPGTLDAPILLVVGRSQIAQAYAVKQMGNATCITAPFDESELRQKLAEILECCGFLKDREDNDNARKSMSQLQSRTGKSAGPLLSDVWRSG